MFHVLLLLTTLSILHLTTAAPTSGNSTICHSKIFDIPWLLTSISLYEPPQADPPQQGWIRFNFIDSNKRLELETICYGDTTNGIAEPNNGGYIACADQDVSFKLIEAGVLMMVKGYQDKCLGPWPYNFGFAYGQGKTAMPPGLPGTAGTLRVQNQMAVTVTGLS